MGRVCGFGWAHMVLAGLPRAVRLYGMVGEAFTPARTEGLRPTLPHTLLVHCGCRYAALLFRAHGVPAQSPAGRGMLPELLRASFWAYLAGKESISPAFLDETSPERRAQARSQ